MLIADHVRKVAGVDKYTANSYDDMKQEDLLKNSEFMNVKLEIFSLKS